MFRQFSFFLCYLLVSNLLFSQKETSNWLFGDRNWLSFYPAIQTKDSCKTYFEEPTSSISDKWGNLIFYSDAYSVYNRNHHVIKNGDGLLGHWSASEGCVFVQKPLNDSVFYLFTNDFALQSNGLRYNIIQLKSNPDSSVVLEKNVQIASKICESISVIHHRNGIYKWIVVHSGISNKISAFLLTDKGLNPCPIETSIGYAFNGGVLTYQSKGKFNNDGTLWAIDDFVADIIKVCNFDNERGVFSNSFNLSNFDIISGIQFSKNSKYMYVVERQLQLVQLNTTNWQKKKIFDISSAGGRMSKCQYGIDGKIYLYWGDSNFLSSIDYPNEEGLNCGFTKKSIVLKNKNTSGLPNFDQSYFYTPAVNFKYEIECTTNKVKFSGNDTISATNHSWLITKNKAIVSSYTTKNISHTFTDTGKHEVRYIVSNGIRKDTMAKTITIYSKLNKQFLGKDTVYAKGSTFSKTLTAPLGMVCQLWQDSSGLSTFIADTAGKYFCKVTNKAFCEVTDTISISECLDNLITPIISRTRDTLFAHQQFADSFVWYRNDQFYRITKESFIKLTDTGVYRVEAAKKGNCNKSSVTKSIPKLGINNLSLTDFNIRLYPNPSSGKVFIRADNNFELLVTDITGKTIMATGTISELTLSKGLYFLCFVVNGNKVTEKVVVF